ncbi:Glucan endo-alpha-glucosidase agn1 [Mycena venus]|uniref:Glucan endo-alpha-glucosidase agn1 n=1 Tax=Mycena venus TaxID=2733690 RepID=A0A8H6XAC5_9AGAR|nr:Glucan endo-alpha-glucosidase agn1 [Mycena venus]
MHPTAFLFVLTWAFALVKNAHSKVVFAHYMVGNVDFDHVTKDIDDAKAAGIQGFSLNIGDPLQPFVSTTLGYMFDYASSVGFHLHISMDIWASGDASGGHPELYTTLINGYSKIDGYFHVNGLPYVTTFSDGGLNNSQWLDWKASLEGPIYFCPDFDGTLGYTTGDDGWWFYWGDVVDCVFSWDAAWPARPGQVAGSLTQGSIEIDTAVINAASSRGKQYNMPLSTLQYKDAYNTNIYRPGDLSGNLNLDLCVLVLTTHADLPNRMLNILSMPIQPDFVTVITWNDGPESHYVGNIWPEQNTDSDPARYVTSGSRWDHSGWQQLIRSFSAAYLSGSSSMLPSTVSTGVEGAMWYTSVMMSSQCPDGSYPDGWETGSDQVNWAVVVGASLSNIVVKVTSGPVTETFNPIVGGLHKGTTAKHPGQQLLEVFSGTTRIAVAQGGRCVSSLCPDNIFNMNNIVVGLTSPGSAPPPALCEDPVCADNTRRGVQQPFSRRQPVHPRQFPRQSSTDWSFYASDFSAIYKDLMVGSIGDDGSRAPRENCVFYVNQRDVDPEDPNYAKSRAVQFADLMNAAMNGGDHHTLYDVYDSALAFSYTNGPMPSALMAGELRKWFQVTSAAAGGGKSSYIIMPMPIPQLTFSQIWDQSIWITDEWPELMRNPLVTQVVEVRPQDIGAAVAHNGDIRFIMEIPYRGGQPPGATPPRDDAQLEIAACVSIDPDASSAKWAGVVDVSGDYSPFKEGHCTFHVHQWDNVNSGGGNGIFGQGDAEYSVEITLFDDGPTHQIGFQARKDAPYDMVSKLDNLFTVTPNGSDLDFKVGDVTFSSGDGSCKVGGWNHNTDRQMDCGFTCTWGGGDSTDHSELGVFTTSS